MTRWRAANLGLAALLATLLGLVLLGERRSPWRQACRQAAAVQIPVEARGPRGEVDRCPTCHQSVLPSAGGRSTHPRLEGHSDLSLFGCTACHGGQGRRLDAQAHQPGLGAGPEPFLKRPFLEARCARCHLPGVGGAPALARGIREYLHAGCSGCHQPGRLDQGLGPDLRRLGRRSEAELLRSILDPETAHMTPVMWSLRWRFNDKTREGKQALAALLTALLAFGEDPGSFRSSWARPEVSSRQLCSGCHRGKTRAGQAKHRCTFLRGNPSLRCERCHHGADTPQSAGTEKSCPQLLAARPTCQVCHGGREARPASQRR
jgi:hypothetical protein